MKKVTERVERLQVLFGDVAENVAKQVGFIQRKQKITAIGWLLAVVFGWTENKNGTIENLVEQFQLQDVELTEQAVSKRFTPAAVEFLKQMIVKAVMLLVDNNAEALPLTQDFNGLYVDDCSSVRLPSDFIDKLPGCGGNGSDKKGASIKTFCRIELTSGNFDELLFASGKTSDFKLEEQAKPLPKGSLHLTDMGFFDLKRLRREDEAGIFWITRIPAGTLLEVDNVQQSVGRYLSTCTENRVDLRALLGAEGLPIRFIAIRAPKDVVRQRLERLRKEAQRKGKSVSEEQKFLCEWTIMATNLSEQKYSADEIYTLYRVRWQVELVFKLWKSEGGLASSHGKTGDRCLCEFLAKLLGQIIANWLMLMRGGRLGEASPTTLYRKVCRSLPTISAAIWARNESALTAAIADLLTDLDRTKAKKKRKNHPSTRQTLDENVTYA